MPKGKGVSGVGSITTALKADLANMSTDKDLPLSAVQPNPSQPRRFFDEEKQEALVASVKKHGVLQPIIVRPKGSKFEIVAGERRYRAAKAAKLDSIPAIIRELDDDQASEVALVENLQRDDLNPIDEVEGLLNLLSIRLKRDVSEIPTLLRTLEIRGRRGDVLNVKDKEREQIEKTLTETTGGKWQSFVKNKLPLLNLPPEILAEVRKGRLAYTKALEVAKVKGEEQQAEALQKALDGASLREIKELRQGEAEETKKDRPPHVLLLNRTKRNLTPKHYESLSDKKKKEVEGLLKKLNQLMES